MGSSLSRSPRLKSARKGGNVAAAKRRSNSAKSKGGKHEQTDGTNERETGMERRDSKTFWISHIKLRKNSRDVFNTHETTTPADKKPWIKANNATECGRQRQTYLPSNKTDTTVAANVGTLDSKSYQKELHSNVLNGGLSSGMENQHRDDSNATVVPQSPRLLPGQASDSIDASNLISIHHLYNYFCDGSMYPSICDPSYMLLLDARSRVEYDLDHIILSRCSATLYRDLMSPSMFGYGYRYIGGEEQLANRLNEFTHVIVYGNSVTDTKSKNSPEITLMKELMTYEVEPELLAAGFESFQHEFPFMCTSKELTIHRNHKDITIYPSLVLANQLYLGRGDQATNEKILSNLRLTHIINISCEHPSPYTDRIEYLTIMLDDVSQSDLKQHFPRVCQFISQALSSNGRILVHCNLGVSRSSTLVISYLMKSRQWTLKVAHDFVKDRRTCIKPNRGFLQQLGEWEVTIFGKRYTDPDDIWF